MEPHAHILVAHEPTAFREVLASELPLLRPRLTVIEVDPADLDAAVARLRPRLVICSEQTVSIRQHASAWIVLYPNCANRAILTIDGRQQVLLNPQLTDLLAAIDAATAGPTSRRP